MELGAATRAAVTVKTVRDANPQYLFGNRYPDATDGKLATSRNRGKDSGLRLSPEWQRGRLSLSRRRPAAAAEAIKKPRRLSIATPGPDPESRVSFNWSGAESTKSKYADFRCGALRYTRANEQGRHEQTDRQNRGRETVAAAPPRLTKAPICSICSSCSMRSMCRLNRQIPR